MATNAKKTAVETEKQITANAASEKTNEKKAVKKRTARKTTAVDSNVYVQFFGKQIATKDVLDSCQADYKNNNRAALKNIEVYVKPEENTAYYVVNGDVQGKVSL